jgi:hypothetical protein
MAHSIVQLRLVGFFSLALCIGYSAACRSKQSSHGERDEVNLNQNVTVSSKAVDVVFKDFEKNWQKFISQSPQLAQPVAGVVEQRENAPEPIITPECVYLSSAGGYVPRVTITWNSETPPIVLEARPKAVKAAAQPQDQTPELRLDLALHHDAFTRNTYSSVLSNEVNQRFNLPSNSALVNNPEAVRLTGPGLFPQLVQFRSQILNAGNQQVTRNTAVVQELSEGLTYQMRVSRPTDNQWTTDQQFIFITPVCPTSF